MRKEIGAIISVVIILMGGYWFYQQATTPAKIDSTRDVVKKEEQEGKQETASSSTASAEKKTDGIPGDVNDPALVLVNKAHPLEGELDFEKVEMRGVPYNGLMTKPLTDFVQGAAEAGVPVTIVSAYRSIAYQQTVIDTQVNQYLDQGDSKEEAMKKTLEYIQTPGASEHHTGLGVDIMANEYWDAHHALNPEADETKSQQWLIEHAPEYGFVLRYPKSEEGRASTGIAYESWHFRYVGVENAKYMAENNLTLEQYWELLDTK